jgi:hypothetical protein
VASEPVVTAVEDDDARVMKRTTRQYASGQSVWVMQLLRVYKTTKGDGYQPDSIRIWRKIKSELRRGDRKRGNFFWVAVYITPQSLILP